VRVLIDLCHPADVHFFYSIANRLNSEGHEIIYTARSKDVVLPLCNEFRIPYYIVGEHHDSLAGKGWELLFRSGKLAKLAKEEGIDVLAGFGNPYIVIAGHLSQNASLFITDTENSGLTNWIGLHATATLTPNWFGPLYGTRHTQAQWFKELAYIDAVPEAKLKTERKYVLIRKVAWTASHDQAHYGLRSMKPIVDNLGNVKIYLIKEKSKRNPGQGTNTNTRRFHEVLTRAEVVISEGATTAAEAALLGRPTIYVNTQRPGYIQKLVEIGALRLASDSKSAASMAKEFLKSGPPASKDLKSLRKECIDIVDETAKLITRLYN
jgi:hypothetical protein